MGTVVPVVLRTPSIFVAFPFYSLLLLYSSQLTMRYVSWPVVSCFKLLLRPSIWHHSLRQSYRLSRLLDAPRSPARAFMLFGDGVCSDELVNTGLRTLMMRKYQAGIEGGFNLITMRPYCRNSVILHVCSCDVRVDLKNYKRPWYTVLNLYYPFSWILEPPI